jgi:hypothetical protein
MSGALSHYKIRFRVGSSTVSEMVIQAMSVSAAREIFQGMMPGATIVSCLRIAGPGMNRREP